MSSCNSSYDKNGRKLKPVIFLFLTALLIIGHGCKKFVEVPAPTTQLSSDNVYTSDATATSVLTGVYTLMATPLIAQTAGETINSISLTNGLSADELTLYGGYANNNTKLVQYYLNQLTSGIQSTPPLGCTWPDLYSKLYTVNLALQRLQSSTGLTPAIRQQLMGEAMFLRAFFYFYLVNLYGAVPLTMTSDYTFNAVLARSPSNLALRACLVMAM